MFTILPLSRKVQNQIRKLRPSDRKKLAEAFKAIEANPYWAPGGKISRFVGDLAALAGTTNCPTPRGSITRSTRRIAR